MRNAVTLSATLPTELHQKVLAKIIEDRYGMRGKSKWVKEALESFLSMQNYPEFVDIGQEMEDFEMKDILSLRVPGELYAKLEDGVIAVRKFFPEMEGVKSKIIRASLMQRLIRI